MTIRVVIADDEPLVRSGIAMLLSGEPDIDVIAEVGDGGEAVAVCAKLHPDVAVLDVRMPKVDGVQATEHIVSARAPDEDSPNVLVLTTFDLDSALYGALSAGAAGFLLKDAAPVELVLAVRAVASGRGWLAPRATRTLIEHFAQRPLGAAIDDPRISDLTARERDVLIYMARGMSNSEIARDLYLGESTIKTHVAHILDKLGVRDRAQAIVFAYQARLVPV
jgi:DNA-binding NarL/FixJ family response regulator